MNGRIIKFEGSVHAEADRILPWWVNGTLPEEEREHVEQHLAECAQCQREAAWLRTLQESYASDEPVAGHATAAMRRLRRRMEGEGGGKARIPFAARRSTRWLYGLAAAQAALVVVLGTALGVALHKERQPVYHTLSAPTDKGALLVVVFDPGISEARMRALVREGDARIVGGPTETGAYLLRVPSTRAALARKMLHGAPGVVMVESLQADGSP